MTSGRLPTYDVIEQANALRDWSMQDDATALCQFCAKQDIWADIIYDWRDRNETFALELKKAKMRIAQRLRQKLHNKEFPYNYGLFMSEIGYHDQFHHDYTESLKNAEAKRRKDIEGAKQSTYNIMVPRDLSIGANVSASPISNTPDKSSQ